MIKSEQASLSVMRIAVITLLTIFLLSACVLAASVDVKSVKIVLSDNCEIEILTTKTVVSDILEENHIVILPEENVVPSLSSEIHDNSSTIVITGVTQDPSVAIAVAEEEEMVMLDQLLSSYNSVVEKVVQVEEEVPYDIIKESETATKITQEGRNGLKKCTYKVKYQNDIEIERTLVKEETISEPINEVWSNVKGKNVVSDRAGRSTPINITGNSSALARKVQGITPIVKTLNTSAYTASTCGKSPSSPSYGVTSSGSRATAWYSVAAGPQYPIGTVIYIPYFASQPNGGWFVVQDRGGAISNNKLDIYMNTYNECISFGRRNLECYIYMAG